MRLGWEPKNLGLSPSDGLEGTRTTTGEGGIRDREANAWRPASNCSFPRVEPPTTETIVLVLFFGYCPHPPQALVTPRRWGLGYWNWFEHWRCSRAHRTQGSGAPGLQRCPLPLSAALWWVVNPGDTQCSDSQSSHRDP
ncbi:hypothetical protein VTI74DRAFT_4500 [Chaetomium olivicolor]